MMLDQVLQQLPGELDWMVVFDRDRLSRWSDAAEQRAMFHLPDDTSLDAVSAVVLSSVGKSLLRDGVLDWLIADAPAVSQSLAERYQPVLAPLTLDAAHCIGVGKLPGMPTVAMRVVIGDDGFGDGEAVFAESPSRDGYGWLKGAGVDWLGTEALPSGGYRVRFRNHLPTHLRNGVLAGYSRTQHCNRFFLQHGRLDAPLAAGLQLAARARLSDGLPQIRERLCNAVSAVCASGVAMQTRPPPGEAPGAMGDLVPLGLALAALRTAGDGAAVQTARAAAERALAAGQQDALWPFQSGGLVTATDSALVLQGVDSAESLRALEWFRYTADGGYVPQLWGPVRTARRMAWAADVALWCQPDLGTSALISGLHLRAGQPPSLRAESLAAGWAQRGALYFANPYLLDWAIGTALAGAPGDAAADCRRRLAAELLASQRDDHSFGGYDRPLSTALAIVTLHRLGWRGDALRLAQLQLLDALLTPTTATVAATPFYSALRRPTDTDCTPAQAFWRALADRHDNRAVIADERYDLTFYEDIAGLVETAFAWQAMACDADAPTPAIMTADVGTVMHPRYACISPSAYVAEHALAPYVAGGAALDGV